MPMIVQHPIFAWIQADVTTAKYPDYDGSQRCAEIGLDAYFYSADDQDEPWFEESSPRPASPYNDKLPHTTYSRLDSTLVKICSDCPFLQPCFAHALANEEYGFWAGTNADDRKRLRRRHGFTLNVAGFYRRNDNEVRHLAALYRQENGGSDGVE